MNINLTSKPDFINFNITSNKDGKYIEANGHQLKTMGKCGMLAWFFGQAIAIDAGKGGTQYVSLSTVKSFLHDKKIPNVSAEDIKKLGSLFSKERPSYLLLHVLNHQTNPAATSPKPTAIPQKTQTEKKHTQTPPIVTKPIEPKEQFIAELKSLKLKFEGNDREFDVSVSGLPNNLTTENMTKVITQLVKHNEKNGKLAEAGIPDELKTFVRDYNLRYEHLQTLKSLHNQVIDLTEEDDKTTQSPHRVSRSEDEVIEACNQGNISDCVVEGAVLDQLKDILPSGVQIEDDKDYQLDPSQIEAIVGLQDGILENQSTAILEEKEEQSAQEQQLANSPTLLSWAENKIDKNLKSAKQNAIFIRLIDNQESFDSKFKTNVQSFVGSMGRKFDNIKAGNDKEKDNYQRGLELYDKSNTYVKAHIRASAKANNPGLYEELLKRDR